MTVMFTYFVKQVLNFLKKWFLTARIVKKMIAKQSQINHYHSQYENIWLLFIIIEKILIVKAANNFRRQMYINRPIFFRFHSLEMILL